MWRESASKDYKMSKIFRKLAALDDNVKLKLRQILQIVYGMSAATLAYQVYSTSHEKYHLLNLDKNDPVYGEPTIRDHNAEFRRLRESGVEKAEVKLYSKEEGWYTVEYDRNEYLKKLEEESLDRAIKAQREWIKKHGELPKGAINLVE